MRRSQWPYPVAAQDHRWQLTGKLNFSTIPSSRPGPDGSDGEEIAKEAVV
jgi:hypothetical protein